MPGLMLRKRVLAAFGLALSACTSARWTAPTDVDRPPVCRDCFWSYQPASFKNELIAFYAARRFADPLVEAQRRMLLATVTNDPRGACRARALFSRLRGTEATREPWRALFVAEALAFTAAACGVDPGPAFREAAARARDASAPFKAGVYADVADGRFAARTGAATIERRLEVPAGTKSFILGSSRIVVAPGTRVSCDLR